VDIPGRSEQQKEFGFFMSTDGIGCSFVCWKPKRQGDGEPYTAVTVPMTEKTVVVGVDPGVTSIATGIRLNPGQDDSDRESVFKISSARWRDRAYHNGGRQRRARLLRQAKKRGIDICKLEKSIPSGKTMRVDVFLKHAVEAVQAYPTLYEHYKQHRVIRWKTYRKEQKAMHGMCMLVKGDPSLKKEDVVVAYGAAQFGSTMVGKQPVPVKRFLNMLKKYVTVVPTPEDRTSRVCSKGCCQGQAGSAPGADELVPMRGEGNKSKKKKGRPLHAVRVCLVCGTIWDRDVNAARNIIRMFWYLREHAGQMPPWARRRHRRRRRRNHN
jgi:transposase